MEPAGRNQAREGMLRGKCCLPVLDGMEAFSPRESIEKETLKMPSKG